MRREHNIIEGYLPSGYFCWFDAIDNLNTGTHNSTTTQWKDRTGTYVVHSDYARWGENYAYTTNGEQFDSTNGVSYRLGTANFTLTAAIRYKDGESDWAYINGETFYESPGTNRYHIHLSLDKLGFWQNAGSGKFYIMAQYPFVDGKDYLLTLRRTGKLLEVFANDMKVGEYSGSLSFNVNHPKIALGEKCPRLYSVINYKRALSDDELTALCDWWENYYGEKLG